MSYKSIDETFWTDPKIKQLNINTKYLFLYLITNPHTHYSGLYYLPTQMISVETGLSEDEIRIGFDTLSKGRHIHYDWSFSVIWIINMCRYQVKNIKNEDKKYRGIATHFETLHKCPLIKDFLEHYYTLQIPYEHPPEWKLIPTQCPTEAVPIPHRRGINTSRTPAKSGTDTPPIPHRRGINTPRTPTKRGFDTPSIPHRYPIDNRSRNRSRNRNRNRRINYICGKR